MPTSETQPVPQREGFPPGVPCWIDLNQPDPEAAAEFYGGLFGWQFTDLAAPDPTSYLVATLSGKQVAAIGSPLRGLPPNTAWNTYIAVASVDETIVRVRDAGGAVSREPFDLSTAGRMAVCTDPSGAPFRLWQTGTLRGAETVNAAGAWNFSEMNNDDPEAAIRFYGAVFGWEADEVEFGSTTGIMVRLPGYADFLEQYDPGIRERHADFGAPPGFSDCIAWILPLRGAAASPHWSVTFSVDDTDAVAARSRELGGTVLTEPFDIPPVRSAVIRDPQGAVFTASSFDPG